MELEATKDFRDKVARRFRQKGEKFTVQKERAEALIEAKVAKATAETKEEKNANKRQTKEEKTTTETKAEE